MNSNMGDVVRLDVGGVRYTTTHTTLMRYPNNMLYSMFSGQWCPAACDADGTYIIDRDGPIFRIILNFLRNGKLCLPRDFDDWCLLESEANFFQIKELIDAIASHQHQLAIQKAIKEHEEKLARRRELEEAREYEFIKIVAQTKDVAKKGRFRYIGSQETLKALPSLLQFLVPFGQYEDEHFVLEEVQNTGEVEEEQDYAFNDEQPFKRMELFRRVTKLGFEVFSTSHSPDGASESWVFRRAVSNQSDAQLQANL